jgi:hypothetical protein
VILGFASHQTDKGTNHPCSKSLRLLVTSAPVLADRQQLCDLGGLQGLYLQAHEGWDMMSRAHPNPVIGAQHEMERQMPLLVRQKGG